jgi:hypothetical protein
MEVDKMKISIQFARKEHIDKNDVVSYMNRLGWNYVGGTEGIEEHGNPFFVFNWTSEKEPVFPDKYDYKITSE